MNKLVYLLWPRRRMAPLECRLTLLEQCAPQLLAIGAAALQMNIADDRVNTPSPAPRLLGPRPWAAQVNLWLEDESQRAAHEDVLRAAGFDIAGYRVDAWLYCDYGETRHAGPRDWPDGQRSPGVLAVTLLERPPRIPRDEWMRRWFGRQSPMSEWMQPRCRYVRNVVEEAVTPGAVHIDGIVEEAWPSREHVANKLLFYGARNRWQLLMHMAIMLHSVTRMLKLWRITTVMMSEYFVKTLPTHKETR
ncbi:MAG: hypothetical protein KBD60_01050 [Sterolibacterium sp.]|jgi:hypothetical protein|nr:hypothetical protein [Sterolibacterium sp.]